MREKDRTYNKKSNAHRFGLVFVIFCIAIISFGCSLKSSNRIYKEAVEAYEAGEYDKAVELFPQAIEKNPDKAEFYLDYGFALIQLGRCDEALEQFSSVMSDKDIAIIKENNKLANRGSGIAYYCSGRYEEAIEWFDKALNQKEHPELNSDILFYKGAAFEMSGRLEEASTVYEQLFAEGKESIGLYRTRADMLRKKGEPEKSLEDYDKALKLSADDFNVYLGKFAALKDLGREEEAYVQLKEAEVLMVRNDRDILSLAQVHYYLGEYEIAKNELNQALEKGFTEAQYFLGEIYIIEKNYKDAYDAFIACLGSGRPANAALYNQLLVCSLQLSEFDLAAQYLEKAKALSDASIRQELARNEVVYLEYTGNYKEALDKIERYLVIYPDDGDAQTDAVFLRTRVTEENGQNSGTGQE